MNDTRPFRDPRDRRTRPVWCVCWIAVLAGSLHPLRPIQAQDVNSITAQQVNRAIERGVSYLRRRQNNRGSWPSWPNHPEGITSLCTLALLNAGVSPDDPMLRRALAVVRAGKNPKTYSVALQTMVLCAADSDADRLQIGENARWLQRNQIASPARFAGSWSYGELNANVVDGDPSNTQFALLALYEAERVGIEVSPIIWRRSLGYWTRIQIDQKGRSLGAWRYNTSSPATGSITCAGIASTIIALGQVTALDARVDGEQVLCCQPQTNQSVPTDGLTWLANNFSVSNNPATRGAGRRLSGRTWYYYYMYALERVGRMTANRFIGDHDWYREGAEVLLRAQDAATGAWTGSSGEAVPELATAMSILFLSKGRRPVVVAKYESQNRNWNSHRHDLNHLTRYVEKRWQRDLSWQVIDGKVARVEDLLQAPILFISGSDGLQLRPDQKLALKEYIDQGGFIFAESCCEGGEFEADFGKLMKELFPQSPMRLLPPDHPIWYAEQRVPEQYLPPLLGIDACCRTSVVYCPGRLSCFWELGQTRRDQDWPESVQQEIAAKLAVGANVLTYATNRELKEKLDVPLTLSDEKTSSGNQRGTLSLAKLRHNGGSDEAAAAVGNLASIASETLQLRINSEVPLVAPTSPRLFDYPIVYVHGRRAFRWTAAERNSIAVYLRRGGFLLADSICASEEFSNSLRRELKAILPESPLQRVPRNHPLLTRQFQGFDLSRLRLRTPKQRETGRNSPLETRVEVGPPVLEAMEIDGRLGVVFSPNDLSCALENQSSITCRGYAREDAIKIGINVLLYAMGF